MMEKGKINSFSRLVGGPSASSLMAAATSSSSTAPAVSSSSSLFIHSPAAAICSSTRSSSHSAAAAAAILSSASTSSTSYSLFSSGGSGLFPSRLFSSPHARLCPSPPASARRGFVSEAGSSADPPSGSFGAASPKKSFRLSAGAHMIPHPAKRDKGGEDAYFLTADGQAMGIADGVGGWALSGVDSGLFSKNLMAEAKKAVEGVAKTGLRPQRATDIMQKALEHTSHIKGSSTAVIMLLDGNTLRYSNLGDSGFMVIRGEEVVFRTREQVHSFNTPFQIGTDGDRPTDADEGQVALQEGDIIVAGTDGLFDNLFDPEIVRLVVQGRAKKQSADELAETIAREAHQTGGKVTAVVPFGKNAESWGYKFQGGKMDDVTVIVSYVSSETEPSIPPLRKAKF